MKRPEDVLTPQALKLLADIKEKGALPAYDMSVQQARETTEKFIAAVQGPIEPMALVKDFVIPCIFDKYEVPVRFYQAVEEDRPLIIYTHGGGWLKGSLNSYDTLCRRLALWSGCHVLSINYRLAPEHKFPSGLNDVESVWQWVQKNTKTLRVLPGKIAMAGDSGGGNLTAAVTHRLVAQKGALPKAIALLYPALNMKLNTASMEDYAEGFLITTKEIVYYRDSYLNSPAEHELPEASPFFSPYLGGYPPVIIAAAACDPLVDEGAQFAEKLKANGRDVVYKSYPGVLHGFSNIFTVFPEAEQSLRWICEEIKKRL